MYQRFDPVSKRVLPFPSCTSPESIEKAIAACCHCACLIEIPRCACAFAARESLLELLCRYLQQTCDFIFRATEIDELFDLFWVIALVLRAMGRIPFLLYIDRQKFFPLSGAAAAMDGFGRQPAFASRVTLLLAFFY